MERRNDNRELNPVGQKLRRRAENALSAFDPETASAENKLDLPTANLQTLSPAAMQKIVHELQVYQIELEMQNEELHRAHWQLETARSRYFDLYDMAPVGYCTSSEQGIVIEANFMASKLLGRARSELVKQPLSRFILKADQDIYYHHRKRLVESRQPQVCELRLLNGKGGEFWAQMSSSYEQDAEGVPVLRTVMNDVSAGKHAEQILRQAEERYRNLFNVIDEGYCVVELIFEGERPVDYLFLEANPAFEKHTGLMLVTGKCMRDLRPAEKPYWLDLVEQVVTTGEGQRVVSEIVSLGRWFDVYASRLNSADKCTLTLVINNVTERKQAEAEQRRIDGVLRNYTTELERVNTIAETANRAKSDLLAKMGHELRTPLSAILGFAQLLESAVPPSSTVETHNVGQILQAGWYLLKLINEILDLAVIESGNLALSLEAVALVDVLRDCATMVEPLAEQRGIQLTIPPIDTSYQVQADRMRLQQVFSNLLSNAVNYNRENGTVELQVTEPSTGRIRVCVIDTGVGLSPTEISLLFEPFSRLGQKTSAQEGSGIGLVISKRLVELMGGVIGVESEEGRGSVFWLELPLALNPISPATPARVDSGETTQSLLYVEDNPANLLLVEELVARRADIRLFTARDGATAIALARKIVPTLIFMDINLPDLKGVEAIKILAQDPATAPIPIVALNANTIPRDIQQNLDSRFFYRLNNPLRITDFVEVLDKALAYIKTHKT